MIKVDLKNSKNTLRGVMSLLIMLAILMGLSNCGEKTLKMQIKYINPVANTFSFVDTRSGNSLIYTKLILDGKEVVDTHCITGVSEGVVFALDKTTIVREPGSVRINGGKAFTVHAVLKYKLEFGILTILEADK
jgi:hypothetical protein